MILSWYLVGLFTRKYIKPIRSGSTNVVYEEKLIILNDMKVLITDMINDDYYIQNYVPTDNLIRNGGYLQ